MNELLGMGDERCREVFEQTAVRMGLAEVSIIRKKFCRGTPTDYYFTPVA